MARWAEEGGRLTALTTDQGFRANDPGNLPRRGAVFPIQRRGPEFLRGGSRGSRFFLVRVRAAPKSERVLAAALEAGGWEKVTRLYRRDDLPEEQCWLRAPGWCLAYR